MFCSKCGSLNSDDSKFCQSCGAKLGTENSNSSSINNNTGVVNNAPINNGYSNNYTNNQSGPINNVNYNDIPTFNPAHSIFLIIFSILCCGGIIGVVFAILSLVEGNKVKDFVAMGNIEAAKKAKKESNKWIKATYITWAVIAALVIIYFAFFMFLAIAESTY